MKRALKMDNKNSFFAEITGFEKSAERVKMLIAMLNRHTYGPEEEKKMDNDPRWITNENPKEDGDYIVTMILENNERVIDTCRFENRWWLTEYVVEAWMPMPHVYVAPKKEEHVKRKCINCENFHNGYCMMMIEDKDGRKSFVSSSDPDFTCGIWKSKE